MTDTYLTIEAAAEAGSRERGSKFLAFAYMVENEADIKVRLEALKRKYHDATHHCYGWRLWWGAETGFDERTRANDDGEPSGTAGKPILNQIVATGLTNVLIVVVRYFGGTKLGVPGLTRAYKEAATEVIANCKIVERTINSILYITFQFSSSGEVMRAIKESGAKVRRQEFDERYNIEVAVRLGEANTLKNRLEKYPIATVEQKGYE